MSKLGTMIAEAQQYARQTTARILRMHPDEVDDVLQTAAVKAIEHASSFRGTCKFKVWFTRIAINEALLRLRRQKAEDRHHVVSVEAMAETFPSECEAPWNPEEFYPCSKEASPEHEFVGNELRCAVDAEVGQLTECLQSEFEMMLLGVGPGFDNARKARRFRLRKILREALQERGTL